MHVAVARGEVAPKLYVQLFRAGIFSREQEKPFPEGNGRRILSPYKYPAIHERVQLNPREGTRLISRLEIMASELWSIVGRREANDRDILVILVAEQV